MLIARSRKFHPEVDIRLATELFSRLTRNSREKVRVVTGPLDLASVEYWRRHFEIPLKLPEGRRAAAEYFVWGRGEPEDPRQTKIGGIPFWPAERKWPTSALGPARFLAQFNFTDSRDLFPKLPGNILVIITQTEDFLYDGTKLKFVWLTGEESFEPQKVPSAFADDVVYHGNIHRTYDFPEASHREHTVVKFVNSFELAVGEATKIGGAASPLGTAPPPGKFLCQLNSVMPSIGLPYPLINRKSPFSFNDHVPALMLGDVGRMMFSLQSNGRVRWSWCCG